MSTIGGSPPPSPSVNQVLHSFQKQEAPVLDQTKAIQLRTALLKDGKIDAHEGQLVEQLLKTRSTIDVQNLPESQLAVTSISFDTITDKARDTLKDVSALGPLNTASDAIQAMQDKGFIAIQNNQVKFDFTKLEHYTSKDIQALINSLESTPIDKKNYRTVSFMLQNVGATLSNTEERKDFIESQVLTDRKALSHMSDFYKGQPMNVVAQGLDQSLKASTEKQTLNFLKETGFIVENNDFQGHWDIRPKALEHLPNNILETAYRKIEDHFWGDTKYAKSALARMIQNR